MHVYIKQLQGEIEDLRSEKEKQQSPHHTIMVSLILKGENGFGCFAPIICYMKVWHKICLSGIVTHRFVIKRFFIIPLSICYTCIATHYLFLPPLD